MPEGENLGAGSKLDITPPSDSKEVLYGGGYEQIYVILKGGKHSFFQHVDYDEMDGSDENNDFHDVLFRCGNWCYRGKNLSFVIESCDCPMCNFHDMTGYIQLDGVKIRLKELQKIIVALQKQQGCLRYYCNADRVTGTFARPMDAFNKAREFCGKEIMSQAVERSRSVRLTSILLA